VYNVSSWSTRFRNGWPFLCSESELADINALSMRNVARLKSRSLTVSDASVAANSSIHTTHAGGTFLTTSSIADLQGDVTLTGSVGPLLVELHLTVKLDPQ